MIIARGIFILEKANHCGDEGWSLIIDGKKNNQMQLTNAQNDE